MTTQSVSEKILQAAFNRRVSEKLNEVVRDFGDLTKGMDAAEEKKAAIMTLEMVETASVAFFAKMKTRISNRDKYSV